MLQCEIETLTAGWTGEVGGTVGSVREGCCGVCGGAGCATASGSDQRGRERRDVRGDNALGKVVVRETGCLCDISGGEQRTVVVHL